MTVTITRRQLLERHHVLLDDYARRTADVLLQDVMRALRVNTVAAFRVAFPEPDAFQTAALAVAIQADLTYRTIPPKCWESIPPEPWMIPLAVERLRAGAVVRAAIEDGAA